MMRKRGRTDANHTPIVEFARDIGMSVQITSALGDGWGDAVFGYRGLSVPVEIKDGSKSPSRRKMSEDEKAMHLQWRGSFALVENFEDVIDVKRRIEQQAAILDRELGSGRWLGNDLRGHAESAVSSRSVGAVDAG